MAIISPNKHRGTGITKGDHFVLHLWWMIPESSMSQSNMQDTSWVYSKITIKFQKIGKAKNMSDSPLTGITRNNISMCLCPGMYTMPLYASSMAHHGERRINHINTQCWLMLLVNSLQWRQMAQHYSTKTVKHLCSKWPALSCNMQG